MFHCITLILLTATAPIIMILIISHLANMTATCEQTLHYSDVTMGTMASQITSLTIVYSVVYSGAYKKNIKAPRHWPLCGEFTEDRAYRVHILLVTLYTPWYMTTCLASYHGMVLLIAVHRYLLIGASWFMTGQRDIWGLIFGHKRHDYCWHVLATFAFFYVT